MCSWINQINVNKSAFNKHWHEMRGIHKPNYKLNGATNSLEYFCEVKIWVHSCCTYGSIPQLIDHARQPCRLPLLDNHPCWARTKPRRRRRYFVLSWVLTQYQASLQNSWEKRSLHCGIYHFFSSCQTPYLLWLDMSDSLPTVIGYNVRLHACCDWI